LVLANTTPTSGVATMAKDTAAMIINLLERSNLAIFFRSFLLSISATPLWELPVVTLLMPIVGGGC